MMHPSTGLGIVSPEIGYGVFAKEFIPKGTIVYVLDELEIFISPEKYERMSEQYKKVVDHFATIDENGGRLVSWDWGKYVNHCCQCNTISTGYGFEIALRDIQAGEQITDEYSIFNSFGDFELICDKPGCRKRIRPDDFDKLYPEWDARIKECLKLFDDVPQPLLEFMDDNTRASLEHYLKTGEGFLSVYNLKNHKIS